MTAGRMIAVLLPLLMAGLATGQSIDDVAQEITDVSPWIMKAAPLALMVGGGDQEEGIGRRMADAGVASQLVTELLKSVTDDDRPNAPNATDGFPSGHASGAWALAEAAAMEDRDVRPYAYAFATLVTWSRVELEDHSGFQALAGAALGYAVGHASAHTDGGLLQGVFVNEPRPGRNVSGFHPHLGGPTLDGTGRTVVVCEWTW